MLNGTIKAFAGTNQAAFPLFFSNVSAVGLFK
jgi:hypothetical protein